MVWRLLVLMLNSQADPPTPEDFYVLKEIKQSLKINVWDPNTVLKAVWGCIGSLLELLGPVYHNMSFGYQDDS